MHTHPRTHTGTIALAAADARAGARKLVEYALRAGSLDNVGVIVVDLRHLFSQTVGAYSPAPTAPPAVDAFFRSMAEALRDIARNRAFLLQSRDRSSGPSHAL